MGLEPLHITADEKPDPELKDMLRRFIVSALLTAPLFALPMILRHGNMLLQAALATPVVLWGGWPFFVRGVQSLRGLNLNMFTLIALGTGASYLYSVYITLRGGTEVYFESAAVIVTLVLLGQVLELKARARTGKALRALLNLAPPIAHVIHDGSMEMDMPLAEVRKGDFLRVRPGEKVPVDGVIVEGASDIDQSMISGEAMPVAKALGDSVIGATLNGTGSFVMRAERVGNETVLAQIVNLVARAQRSRAPAQRLADKVAAVFIPAVFLAAGLAVYFWWRVSPEAALNNAIAVLVIACPCALGLATPMSIMVGMGRAARAGILIRDAAALEALNDIHTLILDKTGTLTEGKPKLASVVPAEGFDETALLRLAASLEGHSEHPIALAIVRAAVEQGLQPFPVEGFRALPGKGVTGIVEGHPAALGNIVFLKSIGIDAEPLRAKAEALRQKGQTVIFAGAGGRVAGLIAVADPIKKNAAEAVKQLKDLRLVVLTGDNQTTAEAVTRKLGITELEAGVSPERKAFIVKEHQNKNKMHKVAMAGDGINDAPALAQADVGIAMATGTDVAMESAAVTLIGGDLMGIVRARKLGRAVTRNIKQNLFLAFVYNAVGIPVAAGALYPLFHIQLSPMIAAAAMSLSSVSVIANALRLGRAKI